MRLSTLTVKTKTSLLVAVPMLGLVAMAAVGWWGSQRVQTTLASFEESGNRLARTTGLRVAVADLAHRAREFRFAPDAAKAADFRRNIDAVIAATGSDWSAADAPTVETFVAGVTAAGRMFEEVSGFQTRLGFDAAPGLTQKVAETRGEVIETIERMTPMGAGDGGTEDLRRTLDEIRVAEEAFARSLAPAGIDRLDSSATLFAAQLKQVPVPPSQKKAATEALTTHVAVAHDYEKTAIALEDARRRVDGALAAVAPVVVTLSSGLEAGAKASEHALDQSMSTQSTMLVVAIVASLGVSLMMAVVIGRSLSTPLITLARRVRDLAEGRIDTAIPDMAGHDEISEIARALKVFQKSEHQRLALIAEQEAAQHARQHRATVIEDTVRAFETTSRTTLAGILARFAQLDQASQRLASSAGEASHQTAAARDAAAATSGNVESVSDATHTLLQSIEAISVETRRTADIARRAHDDAEKGESTASRLSEGATRIGRVVRLIRDVAEQTNLLALNATIEAARAGEAGRGFSVVAGEVKGLADQTSKATEEIARHIEFLQDSAGDVVGAIDGVKRVIEELTASTAKVGTSIDAQSEAVARIADNVDRATRASEVGAAGMVGAASASSQAGTIAGEMHDLATALIDDTRRLEADVLGFLGGVKAA
ncbi:methyl-accepting chemotaxis protein [Siculibacillus lacustris]|uniref:Methyl-accepting chemotaxis protein n=1 Tax=Siculibacillus lacustris TaxID=1549641 RepID=A0A4Q9VUI9_9HYPH|nr:methyl-accepting chemotaxis protein [Siculibacillus lacustris]TBW39825.1 methyl-accepting chemotaxis protein [Siculibacillus lacustris]